MEFFDRLTKTSERAPVASWGAKRERDNDQNDEQVWPPRFMETGEETHIQLATLRPIDPTTMHD